MTCWYSVVQLSVSEYPTILIKTVGSIFPIATAQGRHQVSWDFYCLCGLSLHRLTPPLAKFPTGMNLLDGKNPNRSGCSGSKTIKHLCTVLRVAKGHRRRSYDCNKTMDCLYKRLAPNYHVDSSPPNVSFADEKFFPVGTCSLINVEYNHPITFSEQEKSFSTSNADRDGHGVSLNISACYLQGSCPLVCH